MNEEGLAVGMMAVSEADSGYDPARVTISDLNLIRLVLDYAANVDEAVVLMGKYNIDFGGGPPIHYFLADSSGNSAVVEFLGGGMQVLPNQADWQVSTNFLVSKEQPEGSNSSCWRYNKSYEALQSSAGALSSQAAMELLADVSQPGDYATRWSVVYNMTEGEITLVMGREYDQVYSFSLDK
jgi:choloylglycine hydrolase